MLFLVHLCTWGNFCVLWRHEIYSCLGQLFAVPGPLVVPRLVVVFEVVPGKNIVLGLVIVSVLSVVFLFLLRPLLRGRYRCARCWARWCSHLCPQRLRCWVGARMSR